jgi:hypothetical protein
LWATSVDTTRRLSKTWAGAWGCRGGTGWWRVLSPYNEGIWFKPMVSVHGLRHDTPGSGSVPKPPLEGAGTEQYGGHMFLGGDHRREHEAWGMVQACSQYPGARVCPDAPSCSGSHVWLGHRGCSCSARVCPDTPYHSARILATGLVWCHVGPRALCEHARIIDTGRQSQWSCQTQARTPLCV